MDTQDSDLKYNYDTNLFCMAITDYFLDIGGNSRFFVENLSNELQRLINKLK